MMKKLLTPLVLTGLVVSNAIFIDSNLDLQRENRNLSVTLEQQVNENDSLKEANEVLKNKNGVLSNESIRLKGQVKALENENRKLEKELLQQKVYLRSKQVETNNWKPFQITFYTPRWQEGSGNPNIPVKTATGYRVSPSNYTYKGLRIIATNNKIIPIGSLVDIKFNGEIHHCIVLDNGGAMKKNPYLIDFLVPTVKQAFKYGRQHGQVKIIRKGW